MVLETAAFNPEQPRDEQGQFASTSHVNADGSGALVDKHGEQYQVHVRQNLYPGDPTPKQEYRVVDKHGRTVASAELRREKKAVSSVFVHEQRKGIATALYKHIEEHLGYKLEPNGALTDEGKAFWKSRSASVVIDAIVDDLRAGAELLAAAFAEEQVTSPVDATFALQLVGRSRAEVAAALRAAGYDPEEPRDESGKWTSGGSEPLSHDAWRSLPADPEYLYHATNTDNVDSIVNSHLEPHKPDYGTDQSEWPDGSTQRRSYFIDSPAKAYSFAPAEGKPVLLRVRRDSANFKRESTGDYYTREKIHPSKLQKVVSDKTWVDLASQRSAEDHPFATTHLQIPDPLRSELRAYPIEPQDLVEREEDPHVTVRYGLLPGVTVADVAEIVRGMLPLRVVLGAVSVFGAEPEAAAAFEEEKHPRDKDGQFTSGGGRTGKEGISIRESNGNIHASFEHYRNPEEPIGTSYVIATTDDLTHQVVLSHMYVEPEFRGKGLAKTLIQSIRKAAGNREVVTRGVLSKEGHATLQSFVKRGEATLTDHGYVFKPLEASRSASSYNEADDISRKDQTLDDEESLFTRLLARVASTWHADAPVVNVTVPEAKDQPVPVVNVPAPVVNLPAPVVNVPAPVVNVPAPIVNVTMPDTANQEASFDRLALAIEALTAQPPPTVRVTTLESSKQTAVLKDLARAVSALAAQPAAPTARPMTRRTFIERGPDGLITGFRVEDTSPERS